MCMHYAICMFSVYLHKYFRIVQLYKLGGDKKVRQWNGCGTVLPIRGGGLAGPNWGLLQISFPYVPYNEANLK